MSNTRTLHTDNSWLSRVDTGLNRIEHILALISGIAVLSLMVLAVISVVGRNAFNAPLPGYVDWIEQIMPVIAFFGVAYVQRNGGHIRMDIVIRHIHGRLRWVCEAVGVLITLIAMTLLCFGAAQHFLRSFDRNAPLFSADSSMDIALPLWPAKLVIPLMFAVLCLRLALQLWAYLRAAINNPRHPVAVPLDQSFAEQAHAEANVGDDPVTTTHNTRQ